MGRRTTEVMLALGAMLGSGASGQPLEAMTNQETRGPAKAGKEKKETKLPKEIAEILAKIKERETKKAIIIKDSKLTEKDLKDLEIAGYQEIAGIIVKLFEGVAQQKIKNKAEELGIDQDLVTKCMKASKKDSALLLRLMQINNDLITSDDIARPPRIEDN